MKPELITAFRSPFARAHRNGREPLIPLIVDRKQLLEPSGSHGDDFKDRGNFQPKRAIGRGGREGTTSSLSMRFNCRGFEKRNISISLEFSLGNKLLWLPHSALYFTRKLDLV